MASNKFDAIKISIASPEKVLEWSYGEVTKPETINYRSQKPERDGLFCEKIFGPSKDWECACGKYKKVKYKGMHCDKCGVEITKSSVRRERMGHISLAAPIAHIWFLKGSPSTLAILLDIQVKLLEEVVYFVSWVVTDPGSSDLNYKDVISEKEYREKTALYGEGSFVAQTGAQAVRCLLEQINLEQEKKQVLAQLEKCQQSEKRKKLIKRLEIINAFITSDNRPEWMILTELPVIPPDLRPMLQLDGGRFATSDLNDLYRRVIIRNSRLKKLLELGTPSIIVQNEKRMLQEAVDALFDNGRRSAPVKGTGNRTLKSLTQTLKGKQGRFRQNLLGKRVDFSGRSVIAVGPDLKMYQCGLPREMAINLYKPFVINSLVTDQIAPTAKMAEKLVENKDPLIWPTLEQIMENHPVFLNRAPTLHRLGIQAFKPKIVEGKAIRLHPLVCTAFNADFDGDQMAVHLPLSEKARAEAETLMLASNNILGPKDGNPIVTPSQDMVLGNFYLNMEETKQEFLLKSKELEAIGEIEQAAMWKRFADNEGHVFKDFNEVKLAYINKLVHLHSRIAIPARSLNKTSFTEKQNNSYLITTVGKLIFNNSFPSDFPYINYVTDAKSLKSTPSECFVPYGTDIKDYISKQKIAPEFTKKCLSKVIAEVFERYSTENSSPILDVIKDLGFEYSTIAGMTISLSDISVAPNKQKFVDEARKQSDVLDRLLRRGQLTLQEWEKLFSKVWANAKSEIGNDVMNSLPRKSPINMSATSGARGNKDNFTQLSGIRGLMGRPTQSKSNKGYQLSIIEVPIYSSFREGMNMSEFFISTHGVRKGLTDTALKTAESGYLTRRLVDVCQDVMIMEDDCNTDIGYLVEDIKDISTNTVIDNFYNRIIGRYSKEEILDDKGNVVVESDQYIDVKTANNIVACGRTSMYIRNTFTCKSKDGICKKCYGKNLATGKLVENGEAVGIMAAQSIGEPGTQLTMRTFHTGGVASSGDDITQGLPRVEELFEARCPKHPAIISKIDGEVTEIDTSDVYQGFKVVVTNETESIEHKFNATLTLMKTLKVGSKVKAGQPLTEGHIDPKELMQIAGVQSVANYILTEVKKVYFSAGIDISDKHIEMIIRQMTKKVIVIDEGDSELCVGQVLSIKQINKYNSDLLLNGLKPCKFTPILIGISKSSVETDSFLSASSFQDTTKVLTDAAVKAKVDTLFGIKENVLVGKYIPAGTGSKFERETSNKVNQRAQQLIDERKERTEWLEDEPLEQMPEEITENAI